MIKTMQNTFVFLTIIVAIVLAADDKLNKLPKSHLILEYNWPEPIKNLRRLPHSESCNHFYLTKPDGNHVLKKCFGDDIFDYRSLRCMEKTYAKCWRDIVKKGHKKVKKQQFLCPYHWGLYPDTEDCSQFYDCLSGKPYPTKCPADTLFDKVERTCLPISEARCAGEQGNMKEVKRHFFCRNHRGLYPDTEDCSLFYDCFNGRPYSRKCPAGSLFDKIKTVCAPSSEARCAGEPDVTKIDNVLFKTSPLTETDRISADSESSTRSGKYSTESTSKEESISEDVKNPSTRQAKPTPVFKIITSNFNEMTTDKKHIITSDNSKFSTPRIVSDEDSSKEKKENISEDVKKPSVGQAMLTPVFKIVTSDFSKMTTDKKHIITSDNSKFSTPRSVSHEDSSKEKEENISEDVKKSSGQPVLLH